MTTNDSDLYDLRKSLSFLVDSPDVLDHMIGVFDQNPEMFGTSLTLNDMNFFLQSLVSELNFKKDGPWGSRPLKGNDFGDLITDYSEGLNSFNYRSPEFTNNPDIVFAGCSVSFGIGVPASATWTESVARHLNSQSYVSLAWPGVSANKIVFTIFKYLFTYGKPKKIYALFPDPYRISAVTDVEYAFGASGDSTSRFHPTELHLARNKKLELAKYSKRPHDLEKILIPEVGFRSAIEAIHSLEVLCKIAEIDLIWSTWDIHTAAMATVANINNDRCPFPNFSLLPYKSYYSSTIPSHVMNKNCMPELYEEYNNHYFYGTDKSRYPGAHAHAHIGEGFIKEIEAREALKLKF